MAVRDFRAEYARRNARAQQRGHGSYYQQRQSRQIVKARTAQQTQKRVHAGQSVYDEAYNQDQHDLTPWAETPSSSRISRFRYDQRNDALQVQWRNNNNHGYIYLEVPQEIYRNFARAKSHGKYVNDILNSFSYRLMTPDELSAPSNEALRVP